MRKEGSWSSRRRGLEGENEHEKNKRLRGERERRLRKEYRHPRLDAEADVTGFRIKI